MEDHDHWFEPMADHMGESYLRYSFTKGTDQEVAFLVDLLGLEAPKQVLRRAVDLARERDLKLATVFHAGDGNLHPNICYDRRDEDEVKRVLEAGALILEACIAAGGSLTGEHGVGLEKQAHMCAVFDEDDLDAMRRAREALDPDLRMNPGKGIPVLKRCQEYKALPARHDHSQCS